MPTPTRFGYVNLDADTTENTAAALGGQVRVFTAHTTTLLTGDIVYLHATAGVVEKSTTAADYLGYIGVVVSGDSLKMEPTTTVGLTAATSGQKVLVQIDGIANVIVGATGFTAATNSRAVPSAATAGRVIPGTTADLRVGVCLETQATAGAAMKILIKQM